MVIVGGVTKTIYVVVVDPTVKEGDPFDCGFFPLRASRSGLYVPCQPHPSVFSLLLSTVSVPVLFPLPEASASPAAIPYLYHSPAATHILDRSQDCSDVILRDISRGVVFLPSTQEITL